MQRLGFRLKTLKRHLKEKERWGSKAAEALQKQLREQQQQEAADSKLLQQQLQQKQQQQQLLLLQQKHIAKQFDNEIGDTQRAMKELQQKCNSLEAEFLSLLQSVLQLLQQQLQQPAAVEKELAAAFEKQMQQIKNEVIFKIQNLETKSENKETLGDAWRQIGMQPPHAVTKLGV
ncbi:hypothetical protein, conserved [Eimeria tenella]|uniref:Uncharacterized protein n=1 Tax=Eimeria tenella TaxID=5802 RepID=U6L6V4_EIMTE|nr:hypothetical protein, conserved [Eimeria tenella]CDJ43510.1 hypothetical protein, conserved [Eimeria tenella]|eukprot:XP_013234260.1 hypothetical protein, conserved [Eimeria tenella]